jgi:hypothetical protein
MTNSEILVSGSNLMALVPPVGYRSEWGSLLAFLKLSQGMELSVDYSELDFSDARGHMLESRKNAFGLTPGIHLSGPYSEKLGDDSRRPVAATLVKWRLNGLLVETNLVTSQLDPLRVVYLPLQVPLSDDHHIIVSIVNLGETLLNIATGMQEAVCWADGVAYESIAARVWNGSYLIRPGHATTRRFRLSDFPGTPRHGTHEMSLEILGIRSIPQTVTWYGEPFLEPTPIQ